LYAGLRLREALQLRPLDVSNNFGTWHFIVQPGRGQRVKNGQARLVRTRPVMAALLSSAET
ncbi:MAG TPA: hypothetical protein VF949_13770, partial [Reyranella sp.]